MTLKRAMDLVHLRSTRILVAGACYNEIIDALTIDQVGPLASLIRVPAMLSKDLLSVNESRP